MFAIWLVDIRMMYDRHPFDRLSYDAQVVDFRRLRLMGCRMCNCRCSTDMRSVDLDYRISDGLSLSDQWITRYRRWKFDMWYIDVRWLITCGVQMSGRRMSDPSICV